jgi:hypothetical protein
MTSRERIIAAIHREPVDRVPFDLYDEAGALFRDGRYRPELRLGMELPAQFQARLDFQRRFRTDLIFDVPVPTPSVVAATTIILADGQPVPEIAAGPSVSSMAWQPWPPPVASLFARGATQVCKLTEWANGLRCLEVIDPDSGTCSSSQPVAANLDDLSRLLEIAEPELSAMDASYLRLAHEAAPEVALSSTICGPFSMWTVAFGFERGFGLLADEPEAAEKGIMAFARSAAALGAEMVRKGADLVRIGEANACLVSPAMFRRFALEPLRLVAEAIHDAGGHACLHLCGRAANLLELAADTGAPILETLTPPPTGDVTLSQAKAVVGSRLCLKGNLDPVHVVGQDSPELVAQRTRECLGIGSPGSGFILSVADCLMPGTPERNLEVIAEIVLAL